MERTMHGIGDKAVLKGIPHKVVFRTSGDCRGCALCGRITCLLVKCTADARDDGLDVMYVPDLPEVILDSGDKVWYLGLEWTVSYVICGYAYIVREGVMRKVHCSLLSTMDDKALEKEFRDPFIYE